ncbi:interleukin-17 receptor E isoform X2 [Clupea harengus]|uniref:Interleukin-17 receptor E isoform X2 n=1 Tax=Clupea harengus TaxID=7950 RepID=A0A6P8FGC8_CLUHA|nr:interleukin-17 receptor E isoform X2 [Clupea harengus]
MLTFPIALKNVFVAPHTLGDLIALFIFAMILDSMLARATFMIYLLNVIKEIQQNPMDFTTNLEDQVPHLSYLDMDLVSHSFLIMREGGPMVNVRLCYRSASCVSLSPPVEIQMNTTHSLSTNISFPYLLPCLCIQVYYDHPDAMRRTICPFENMTQNGVLDVLSSGEIRVYNNSKLTWHPLCPSAELSPSAKLCWNNSASLADCVILPNTTLQAVGLIYDVSDVDRHPQMCIQLSLNNSHYVHCPFKFGHVYQWEVTHLAVVAGHLRVSITSNIPACFAGQLCAHVAEECVAIGDEGNVCMEGGSSLVQLVLSLPFRSLGMCVQVWRLQPVLHGRRIFCLDYPQMHRRWGLIVGATLAFLLTLVVLGNVACHQFSKRFSGCGSNRPVLLVSSSDDASHISAVLALASGLQAELHCSVRLALWDHCASQDSIAHLGPVPWLHAQCHTVLQTGGMVLIAWSSSASGTWKWKGEGGKKSAFNLEYVQLARTENNQNLDTNDSKQKEWTCTLKGEKDIESHGAAQKDIESPIATQKAEWQEKALQGCREQCEEKTSVTAPVLVATLSCVQAALQSGLQIDNFIVLHFQKKGLKSESESNGDLPAVLHTLPTYYLPQNLPKLVLKLRMGSIKTSSCWLWLTEPWWAHHVSWRLAQRLQDCLHQG